MKNLSEIFIALFFVSAFCASSQPADVHYVTPQGFSQHIYINSRIRVIQGNPEELTPIKRVKITFDYSEMWICKYDKVEKYLADKTKTKSELRKAEAIQQWQEDMQNKFQANFRDEFDGRAAVVGISSSDTAAVELRIKTLKIEPHKCKYDSRGHPYVYLSCEFLNASGHRYVTYELTAFGTRNKNDNERTAECYLKAGRMLGAKVASYFGEKETERRKRNTLTPSSQ